MQRTFVLFSVFKYRFGFLEPLSRLCYKHAWFVADHPWPFIMIPLMISVGLGVGYFFKFENQSTYAMFTPNDGYELIERQTIRELFPPVDGTYSPARSLSRDGESDLVVSTRDGGNILRTEYRGAVKRLNKFVMHEIYVRIDGLDYNYQNICLKFLHFCHNNPQIYAVDAMLSNKKGRMTI